MSDNLRLFISSLQDPDQSVDNDRDNLAVPTAWKEKS